MIVIVARMDVVFHRGKRMRGWVSKEEKWRVKEERELRPMEAENKGYYAMPSENL